MIHFNRRSFGASGVIFCAFFTFAAIAWAGSYSGGTGTAEDPYKISTVADWQELIAASGDWDKSFILLNDIDFGGVSVSPIGNDTTAFSGVFDGNGHTISGFTDDCRWWDDEIGIGICRDRLKGLFGKNLGTLQNLGLLNCNIVGGTYVGCLVARNQGIIVNCFSTGSVSGTDIVGGLVGFNEGDGMIVNCYSKAEVWGRNAVGGLVGVFIGGTICNCYSTGPVGGYAYWYGGLVGDCYDPGGILNSFWDTQTSGEPHGGGGGTGKTTAEMKALSTFTLVGWDFVGESVNGTAEVWRMCADGVDYPRLSWEFSGGGDFACPDGVALEDLLYLAERWMAGTPETIGTADWNRDGKVDMIDLATLSGNWGK